MLLLCSLTSFIIYPYHSRFFVLAYVVCRMPFVSSSPVYSASLFVSSSPVYSFSLFVSSSPVYSVSLFVSSSPVYSATLSRISDYTGRVRF